MLCTAMAPVRSSVRTLRVVGDASSGELALALIGHLRPDIVLMDVRLPDMNGIEVTRRLIRDLPDICVLMVSANGDDEYVHGARQAGAAGYLSKTAPGKELVQAVRSVARGTTCSSLVSRLGCRCHLAPPSMVPI